jgi:chromosome condensin MukBEF MukE localization factor
VSRLFWLGVGVAAGVTLSRKLREKARQASPAGVAENIGDAMHELAAAVGAFGADVRAGMAEREKELHDVVDERSGVHLRRTGARARRADD